MAKKNDNVEEVISQETAEEMSAVENADTSNPMDEVASVTEDSMAEDDFEEDEAAEEARKVLSPEEYDQFKELQKKIFFRGKKVAPITRSERRRMYAGERIVTEDGEISAETEATDLKEDILELAASAKSQRILEGRIIGCRDIDGSTATKRSMAVVEYGHKTCQVLIPDFVLFHYDYKETLDETTQRNVKRRIENMLGASIKFVVKHLDQKNRVAYADRLKAMENISWNNYVRETREGGPRVIPGMIAQATVIAVSWGYIIVNVLGSDTRIVKSECSWGFVEDCRTMFDVNDKVNVKILGVKENTVKKSGNEIYNLVFTSCSVKQATSDPVLKYFGDYAEGGKYVATVTGVNDIGVFVNIDDKVPALVAFPKYGDLPTPGEQRIVQITGKEILDVPQEDGTNKQTHRIFGVIAPK